jgi:Tol biopolymer transport system component
VAAVAVIAALALAIASRRTVAIDTQVYRTSILLPADVTLKYASANPETFVSLSPDGRQIAFLAEGADGRTMLWVRPLDLSSAHVLPGTEDAGATPTWSPDGYFIAFRQGRQLKKIDTRGGSPVALWSLPDGESGIGGIAWNRDGVILLGNGPGGTHGILRISADGGTAMPVLGLDSKNGELTQGFPAFLPDGRHFLYTSRTGESGSRIYVASLDGHERKVLIDGAPRARYALGYLLFNRERTVFAQAFDADRLELRGSPVPVVDQVAIAGAVGWGAFSASDTGVLAFWSGNAEPQSRLEWVDRSGGAVTSVGQTAGVENFRLSPDGKRAVAGIVSADNRRDLWMYDLSRGGVTTRLTFDGARNIAPIWSPDGTAVLFSKNRGNNDLFTRLASGAGKEEVVWSDHFNKTPVAWSHDGRFVLYVAKSGAPTVPGDLYWLPLSGDGRKPVPLVQSPFDERGGTFSPDDRWVAYSSDESGRYEVYAIPFPGPGGKFQISASGARFPRWSDDGREIFFLGLDNTLMSAAVTFGRTAVTVTRLRPLLQTHPNIGVEPGAGPYDVTSNGRFLVNTIVEQAAPAPITLIVNWTAGLKRQ